MLVADALDVVLAEAVVEHRRALERLDRDDPRAVALLQPVAGAERARRAGGGDEGAQACSAGSAARSVSKTCPSARPVQA